LLLSASAGNDIMFDENCVTKVKRLPIKFGMHLIKGWEVSDAIPQPESSKVAIEWYEAKLQQTLLEIEDNLKIQNFRCVDGNLQMVWDDFCSWFLRNDQTGIPAIIDVTLAKAIEMLENNLKLLHPLCRFD
jgi:valyl-tRNA synthetase